MMANTKTNTNTYPSLEFTCEHDTADGQLGGTAGSTAADGRGAGAAAADARAGATDDTGVAGERVCARVCARVRACVLNTTSLARIPKPKALTRSAPRTRFPHAILGTP